LHLNQWNAVIAGKLFVKIVVRIKNVQMVAIARVSSELAKFAKKILVESDLSVNLKNAKNSKMALRAKSYTI
jgi:hypothetical protein